jgi:DNA-binding GntR family transcriptional regulator
MAASQEPAIAGRSPAKAPRPASEVLADRIAAVLAHHEPGWRLPRLSALARRYSVTLTQIDAALEELAARHLIRRLPDGQVYRASPAEYLIAIDGVPRLACRADPMGWPITCRSRQVTLRPVPEDIGWALRVPPADPVGVIRMVWTAGSEPAAVSTTYLLREIASPFVDSRGGDAAATLTLLPMTAPAVRRGPDSDGALVPVGEPQAMHVEMQPPPPSVARSLRLTAGQPAALVTVRFDNRQLRRPVALTVAVFRADMFRIVVESGTPQLAQDAEGSLATAWTHAVQA